MVEVSNPEPFIEKHSEEKGICTMKKVLNLVMPPVKTYQFLAYPLSIILSHEEAWPWFYSNFIQLYSINRMEITMHSHGDFESYPWLAVKELDQDRFSSDEELLRLIIRSLNNEEYVYLFVDELFVENTTPYQKYSFIHDILINGYDFDEKVVYVSGFSKNRSYSFFSVSFNSIAKASISSTTKKLHNRLITLKYRKYRYENYTYLSYNFDIHNIIEQLEDFLNNRNSSQRLRMLRTPNHYMHGLQVYQVLRKQVEIAFNTNSIDIRPFHCIYEHKTIMMNRLDFLANKLEVQLNNFSTWANQLQKQATILRNLALKYHMAQKKELLPSIAPKINELETADHLFVSHLLQFLKSHVEYNKQYYSLDMRQLLETNPKEFIEGLVSYSRNKDNYAQIYDIVANLPIETIGNMYNCDQSKTAVLLAIFLEGMTERLWPPGHIQWFLERCEKIYPLIEEKELIIDCLKKVAKINKNQGALDMYMYLAAIK